MLCILLGKVLHICYKGIIFVSEIKQNTNSTDPRRSLKSAQKNYENDYQRKISLRHNERPSFVYGFRQTCKTIPRT